MEKHYSISEAAQQLGVSYDLMYDRVRYGEIESVRVGRRRRISETALQQYLQRNTDGGVNNVTPLRRRRKDDE